MTLSKADTTVNELSSFRYTGQVVDEEGNAIPGSSLSSLTLTLYNAADKSIINSRDKQDVLDANAVTVNESGDLTWDSVSGDSPIVGSVGIGQAEQHVALFEWTWGSNRRGSHLLTLYVVQMHEVP